MQAHTVRAEGAADVRIIVRCPSTRARSLNVSTSPSNQPGSQEPEVGPDGIPAPSGPTNLIDTDYVVGQDNFSGKVLVQLDIHSKVFLISSVTILLFVLLTLALQSEAAELFTGLRAWLDRKSTRLNSSHV